MKTFTGKMLAVTVLALSSQFLLSGTTYAKKPEFYQSIVKGVALGGYDPIAYFTTGKPTPGLKTITYKYKSSIWRFSSESNRAEFISNPQKYAPQYGGYCAWAVSQGYTAKGDPNAWKIHKGKLYLNYNKTVQATWARNIPKHIKSGNKNWPEVLR